MNTDHTHPSHAPVALAPRSRRELLALGGAAAAIAPLAALAPFGSASAQSRHLGKFEVISPAQPVAAPDKVEVLEVFSFACPHCWRFMPVMASYEQRAPDYVLVKRMPAIFRESWVPLAQAFYSSQALGVEEEMRAPLFEAVHVKKENLVSQEAVREVFTRNGIDAAKFDKAYNSFSVKSRINEGYKKQRLLGIQVTPTVVVHGKYRVTSTTAGSTEGVLDVIAGLSEELRPSLKTG